MRRTYVVRQCRLRSGVCIGRIRIKRTRHGPVRPRSGELLSERESAAALPARYRATISVGRNLRSSDDADYRIMGGRPVRAIAAAESDGKRTTAARLMRGNDNPASLARAACYCRISPADRHQSTTCRPKTLEGASPVSGLVCLLFPTLRSARSRSALLTRRDSPRIRLLQTAKCNA